MKLCFNTFIIVLIIISIISCSRNELYFNKSDTTLKDFKSLTASNHSKLQVENEYGSHIFDLSNIEQGIYTSTKGFISAKGSIYPALIHLSDEYLQNIRINSISKNTLLVQGINYNNDIAQYTIIEKN